MATFQVNKSGKNKNSNLKQVAGWIILALSTFVFLFSVTKIVPDLQYFFLGILGIFVYPLSVLGFIIALALLNNKKYVMPKKYAIFLSLSLVLFLSIIQLIIIGSPSNLSYGSYIALNYTKQITAGGMIIGFIPASLAYLMGLPATYVVLAVAFITCVAFFVEAVISLRKTANEQKPIKLQIKEKKESVINNPRQPQRNIENDYRKEMPRVNVMLAGNREEEEKKELSAREKLGLVGGYQSNQYAKNELKLPEEKEAKGKVPEGMSIREYLLSPPKVDIEKFMDHKPKPRQTQPMQPNMQSSYSQMNMNSSFSNAPQKPITNSIPNNNVTINEINRNIEAMKNNEEIKPSSFVHEESYDLSQSQALRRGNLPDVKPEEITSEAEDIIRQVVEQEKIERKDDIEKQAESNYSDYIDYNSISSGTSSSGASSNEKDSSSINRDLNRASFDRDNLNLRNNVDDDDDNDENNDINLIRERERINAIEESKKEQENSLNRNNNLVDRNDRNNLARQTNSFDRNQMRQEGQGLDRSAMRQEGLERPTRPMDEMEKRKKFVQLDEEKPPEKIKPYKYTRPPLDLITTKSDDLSMFNEEIPMKRVALENALENFGVPAKVQNVVIGPTVTRYEIEMPEGISVKRILSLDADIAYALSANGQIRIEAPIPGRSIVGIEVPNNKVAKVSIKDVLQSKEFTLSPSPLTFALGKDITGNVRICNLQKMPHLLVAGTTGSGKSVCLNTIITSILYKASPDEVKFIMIDPKQVELSMYEGLPHMVVPRVITDPTKAVNALQWAVDEMERRFKLISEERVRNIGEYNKIDKVLQNKVRKMPYIVIIFDEFADFMAVAKNEIEDKIRRLAGKARAAGIHLILATQRPSTDVVTGTLKANLPARIAFKVAGRVDSEVILGMTGAEKLLGYGDMLYKPADAEPARLQGCFIDTPETKDIVNFITANNEEIFDEEANNAINNPNKASNNGGGENNGVDPLLPQALKICIDNGVASTTMVQRKLSIGYPRAARIVDQMEERGYISSAEGSKQRSVYITIDEFYSIFGDIYD